MSVAHLVDASRLEGVDEKILGMKRKVKAVKFNSRQVIERLRRSIKAQRDNGADWAEISEMIKEAMDHDIAPTTLRSYFNTLDKRNQAKKVKSKVREAKARLSADTAKSEPVKVGATPVTVTAATVASELAEESVKTAATEPVKPAVIEQVKPDVVPAPVPSVAGGYGVVGGPAARPMTPPSSNGGAGRPTPPLSQPAKSAGNNLRNPHDWA